MRSLTLITATLLQLLPWTTYATDTSRFGHARIVERQSDLKESYDYIIAGAGTAGLTLADRLTEDGKCTIASIDLANWTTVLTIVSNETIARSDGRNFFDPGINYNITSIPQPAMNNRTQAVRIGCCVGGSSAVNGMVFVRGTKPEYDGWKELGGPNSTWDWEGVLPYFRKATHFNPPTGEMTRNFNVTWNQESWGQDEGTKLFASFPDYGNPGVIPFYNAAAAMPGMPIPIDGASGQSGLFWNPTSMDNERYWRSYSRTAHYDGKVDTRENYDVITMHKVTKVLFDGDLRATGVQMSPRGTLNQTVMVRANKEVIISAGTVHTPQILQNSGVGPKDLLEEAGIEVKVDLPGVGQNFQDHAYLSIGYRWGTGRGPTGPNITQTGSPRTIAGPNLGAWLGLPSMTNTSSALASAYEAQDPSSYLPANTHPSVLEGYTRFQKLHAALMRSTNANWLWLPLTGNPGGIVMSEHVVSHGSINIDPKNPDAEPIVDYRALSNPIDMDVMVENIRYMRRFMASPSFAQYQPIETNPGIGVEGEALKEWIRRVIIPTNFHPIGTAAKMPKEWGGVVDEELRVHGVKGLRVVDGSVMPSLPGANTQQTVYMIAEKAADMIKAAQ